LATACGEVERARAEGGDADAGAAGQAAVGRGHERSGLLVAGEDELDRGRAIKRSDIAPKCSVYPGTTERAVDAIKQANEELSEKREEKQLLLGIEKDDFRGLSKRMVQFLNEAGLIYEHPDVSHGEGRVYRRFRPP
jgi:hypothetical protein